MNSLRTVIAAWLKLSWCWNELVCHGVECKVCREVECKICRGVECKVCRGWSVRSEGGWSVRSVGGWSVRSVGGWSVRSVRGWSVRSVGGWSVKCFGRAHELDTAQYQLSIHYLFIHPPPITLTLVPRHAAPDLSCH